MMYPGSFEMSAPGDREIRVTRLFNAPRALVFEAFTKPELVQRWLLGPAGWTMPICEIDLRVGGAYRYVWRQESNGSEIGLSGIFREIARPERLVATEKTSWHAEEAIDTTVFTEEGPLTRMTLTVLFETTEARDAARRSGMDRGMAASYNRAEELLGSLVAG
jgi:uncharacterized protein YndB with AHSA1/START domain